MSDNSENPKVTILIAAISVIGTLGTALFTNWDKVFPQQGATDTNKTESVSEAVPKQIEVKFNVYTKDYEPIESVEVRFISNGAPSVRYTDSNGYVTIEVPERKDIEIILSKDSFKTKRQILNLKTDPNRTFTLYLQKINKNQSEDNESDSSPKQTNYYKLPPINTSPTSELEVAVVFDPPSNVRSTPNGQILCSIRERTTINIYSSKDDWYHTDVCGSKGFIHSSQITFSPKPINISPTSTLGVAIVFDPPSNVRSTPNGQILCSIRERTTINIYSSEDDWYHTDVCGSKGFIHSSQITFQPN